MLGKILANFMQILQELINVQTMLYWSIYSFDSVFLHIKQKILKVFLFNILTIDYECGIIGLLERLGRP